MTIPHPLHLPCHYHPRSALSLIPTLSLLLLLLTQNSTADFCNSDPRVALSTRKCSSPRTLLHLPLIDSNPYHALHDRLWAVAHYISHCTTSPLTINITLPLYNHTLCLNNHTPLRWGLCVVHAMKKRSNAALTNTPDGCFSSEVRLGVEPWSRPVGAARRGDFRGMSWLGCKSCAKNDSLIPLSQQHKTHALTYLRDSVLQMIAAPKRQYDARVHVLLYDRNDTKRRQWVNAHEVYDRLKHDERVELKYMRRMPLGFKSQILLYMWTDILIAPHGGAMVNTVFMRKGSEIIEIWKHCNENVVGNPTGCKDWTGWHAGLLGIGLRYVQCHRAELRYKNESELERRGHGAETAGRHKARVDEVVDAFEQAMARQRTNSVLLTEGVAHSDGMQGDGFFFVLEIDENYDLARRVIAFVLIPSCTTIFILWTLFPRNVAKLKRSNRRE